VYGDRCQTCHHRVDEQEKQLVPGRGEELGCRACHLESVDQSRTASLKRGLPETLFTPKLSRDYLQNGRLQSLRRAAHLSCVGCHLERQDRNQESGPQTCAGCHSRAGQSEFEPLESRERLQRGQPDWSLIGPGYGKIPETEKQSAKMTAVAFNHRGHESEASTCRSCHHMSQLKKCRECHTLQGDKAGDFVGLTRAMHLRTDTTSCLGCHQEIVLDRPQCAGCHQAMEFEGELTADNCQNCHLADTPEPETAAGLSLEEEARLAKSLFKSRLDREDSFDLNEIPEQVEISELSRQYGPVTFPHRMIARELRAGMIDSRLAAAFHQDKTTLCRGCHHHTPPSENPPPCSSCHSDLLSRKAPDRPGLKAAYHLQCMDCHTWMGIDEPADTDCTSCHEQLSEQVISDEP
ncbi:MAG: sulfate respiration complex hexadecaheme cytochrome HmcA, partial [Thermodesulfobacteriota bacterium]